MLIHARKSWSLLLVYLIAAILVIIINKAGSYENWMVTAVPCGCVPFRCLLLSCKQIIGKHLHWVCFSVAIVVNYFCNCQLLTVFL